MDDAKGGKVKPDRQSSEPADGILMGRRVLSDLAEKFGVLVRILCRMTPQELAVLVPGYPPDRVEFVISHDGPCRASFAHGAGNSKNLPLLRAAIYKITNEDHLPFWMSEGTFDLGIAERA
jgi:hypothetical protein